MNIADDWKDYELIETKNGMKKERWGKYILVRPDPQIIWQKDSDFTSYDAIYYRSNKGGGHWEYKNKLPDNWQVRYKELTFNIKPMGFKHTGLFPEQAVNWDYMINKIKNAKREIKVLNLFAYTGGASVACLYAGASVCHVDSSKGMVSWAKENVASSNLSDKKIRYIVDDVVKFVEREIRRGNKYDAIIIKYIHFSISIYGRSIYSIYERDAVCIRKLFVYFFEKSFFCIYYCFRIFIPI